MRTSILAITIAFGTSIAVPALAQQSTAPSQPQMQSDKQMQEEADKGIKTRELRTIRICGGTGKAGCFCASARTTQSEQQPDDDGRWSEWRRGFGNWRQSAQALSLCERLIFDGSASSRT